MKSLRFLIPLGITAGTALAQTSAPVQSAPPAYTPVRWDENYSYLSDPDRRTDWADPVKYIPLDRNGEAWLSLGGQARYRYELFDNFNFGAGQQDGNGYHLYRFLAHADVHFGEHLRFFVQGKSAWEQDRTGGPRPPDEDHWALQQAFGDLIVPLSDDTLTVRLGRQDLLYGAQRLISPLDWTNGRRTFQGARASLQLRDKQTIDLFWVQPVVVDGDGWDEQNNDVSFAGAYYGLPLPHVLGASAGSRWEAYVLALNTDPTIGQDVDRYTIGTRFRTAPKPWDVDVELDGQVGETAGESIGAWSVAIEGGYTFSDVTLAPRLFAGFDAASGGDAGERFDQLFPLGHAYFGYMDVVGRQNIVDAHPGVVLALRRNLSLRTEQHFFWRQDLDDALYNAAGGVQRADTGTDARFVGTELDLLLNWQVSRHWAAYTGFSHFWPGDFLDETGADEAMSFVYAAAVVTF